jgi:hypothetical protein
VLTLLHDPDAVARASGQPFCKNATGKAGADNDVVHSHVQSKAGASSVECKRGADRGVLRHRPRTAAAISANGIFGVRSS